MKRLAAVGIVMALLGSVVPAQDDAGQETQLGGVLQDVNLHDLTVAVQKITGKTFLWTEDLGLRTKRVHLISDTPIAEDPKALFKAYQSILQVSQLMLVTVGKPGSEIFKIKPSNTGLTSANES